MSNAIEKLRNGENALDAERSRMNEALQRLGKTEERRIARRTGRLIFGLDLTGSREVGLKQARVATAAMFEAVRSFGSIEMKLVYYRGALECRESQWSADVGVLCRSMLRLSCENGSTQIARLLWRVLREREKLSAAVFVGDHCEDIPEVLLGLAEKLRDRGTPLFVFHECSDHDPWSLDAKPLFRRMAEISGGVYVEFKPDSGEVLKELLASIAAFSTAGMEGLGRIAAPATAEARQLREGLRLMLGVGNNNEK